MRIETAVPRSWEQEATLQFPSSCFREISYLYGKGVGRGVREEEGARASGRIAETELFRSRLYAMTSRGLKVLRAV